MTFHLTIYSQNTSSYIVKLVDNQQLKNLENDPSISHVENIFPDLHLYLVNFNDQKSSVINKLKDQDFVQYVHKDIKSKPRLNPNDPSYPTQWGLSKIQAPEAWDISTGGTLPNGNDIVVAVFDEGFQIDHPDYEENIWTNRNEIPNNGIDDDANGYIDDIIGWNSTTSSDEHRIINHGTSVAGIIGAVGNNRNQIAGLNWNVKMMLTSAGRNEFINLSDIVKAYNYIYTQRKIYNETAGAKGAYVVVSNYSGGAEGLFPEDFPSWCEVYDALGSVGILNITSAPNTDSDVDADGDLPSTCQSDFLIIVTNTDRQDNKVQRAGYGSISVDIGAPGDGIVTTAINSQIDSDFSGASASAPHVAGAISLLYSLICEDAYQSSLVAPIQSALIMKRAIYDGADPVSSLAGITTTGKRLNLFNSMKIIDTSIGDCCEVTLDNLDISSESCQNAKDISVDVNASGFDLKGNLIYRLIQNQQVIERLDGSFVGLSAGQYEIQIVDSEQNSCAYNENIVLDGSQDACPFGEFGIQNVSINNAGTLLEINYDLSEQQDIRVLIYNALGQKAFESIVRPELSEARSYTVNIAHYPAGVYFVSLQATTNISTRSILVRHP